MKNFSNRSFIQLITPQTSTSSSQTAMLLGISLVGLSVLTIVLFYKYRQQTEWMNSLKKQNAFLSEELDAAESAATISENISNEEDSVLQTDN